MMMNLCNKKGFTLLEMIVAMTLLSLVALIIPSSFRLGLNAWEKGETETGETQRLRALSGLITQQLKSAYPYEFKVDETEKAVLFQGESDSLLLVTALADSSFGGFKWVRYSYKEGTLQYKEGLLPDKEVLERLTGDEEVLDRDIGEVKFEYASSADSDWKESWDLGEKMPGAVRVKIAYFQPFVVTMPMSKMSLRGETVEDETP